MKDEARRKPTVKKSIEIQINIFDLRFQLVRWEMWNIYRCNHTSEQTQWPAPHEFRDHQVTRWIIFDGLSPKGNYDAFVKFHRSEKSSGRTVLMGKSEQWTKGRESRGGCTFRCKPSIINNFVDIWNLYYGSCIHLEYFVHCRCLRIIKNHEGQGNIKMKNKWQSINTSHQIFSSLPKTVHSTVISNYVTKTNECLKTYNVNSTRSLLRQHSHSRYGYNSQLETNISFQIYFEMPCPSTT